MTAHQLEAWLEMEESKKVGYKDGGQGESVGHHSGRRIVEILGKKKVRATMTTTSSTWPRSPATSIATWPQ